MMRDTKARVLQLVMATTIFANPAAAQVARPAGDAQTISRGWAALAAGRTNEAVTLADGILQKKPKSHAAFSLKIEALSAGAQPIAALDAYEAWLQKAGRTVDDRGLLQPIAAGLLRVLAGDSDAAVRATALKGLAENGEDTALDSLRKYSAEGDQRSTIGLADRGDAQAIASLQTLVGSGSGRDVSAAIDALAEHGGLSPNLLDTLLKDRVPMNRAAAVRALGRSTDSRAAQQLEALSRDPDGIVRTTATLARAKNGDTTALAAARVMLASEVADIRLFAAETLQESLPVEAEQAARPLLTNRDGVYRFRAAAIVGRTDPAAVQSVLIEGLGDQNPLVQQEAGRIAAAALPDDIVLLRQLLRHADRSVVANAAGAILGH
jgi:HEAT repeat protein